MTTLPEQPAWAAATAAMRAAERILVVTHLAPDGDAVGSALGLAHGLLALGKQVTVADDDPLPEYLDYVPGINLFQTALNAGSWDLMISTDASDEPRTGQVGVYGRANSRTVINLDHHISNTGFGDIHLIVPQAASAAEIVFDWWEYAAVPLSQRVAVPLLTGIVTDTIGFRTSSTTARTLYMAQRLIEAGASLTEITARTLDSKPFNVIELWKELLPQVTLEAGVIQGAVRQADLARAQMAEMTDGGLVSFLIQVNEAMIAVVFKEQAENMIEISLRAKLGFDVSGVALQLGGGGHKQAAGATIAGSLDEVRARVLPLVYAAAAQGQLQTR